MKKNKFKKVLFAFLITIAFVLNLIYPFNFVKAQSTYNWYDQPFQEWYYKVYDKDNPQEIFGERYTAAQVQWVIYSIPSAILNFFFRGNSDLISCTMLLTSDISNAEKTFDFDTCIGGLKTLFENLFKLTQNTNQTLASKPQSIFKKIFLEDRGLSGIAYIRNSIKKFNIVPVANAQKEGAGFTVLGPLNKLWKISRNIAFGVFSLLIIIFSFMIMFRVKINPQTVITIQSALPKIIISMILVTFSFAIAGFMIDLMYVTTAFLSVLLSWNENNTNSIPDLFAWLIGEVPGLKLKGFITLVIMMISYIIYFLLALLIIMLVLTLDYIPLFPVALNNLGSGFMAALLVIAWFVIIFILIINLIRIPWMLYKNLAEFYIQVIIGPIKIALGTLSPTGGFKKWLLDLISKLAVFPAIGVLWYLAFRLLTASIKMSAVHLKSHPFVGAIDWISEVSNQLFGTGWNFIDYKKGEEWIPPWIGGGSLPIAFMIMSMMCVIIMPKVAKLIKSFMAGKEADYGTAIGEAMRPAQQAGQFASPFIAGEAGKWLGDTVTRPPDSTFLGKIRVLIANALKTQARIKTPDNRSQQGPASPGSQTP